MENTAFNHAAWNTLHSIRMLWAMLQKIHCNQSGCIGPRCMDSTAYNRDPLRHNAWNPLHSMMLHGIHCIPSGCILPMHLFLVFGHAQGTWRFPGQGSNLRLSSGSLTYWATRKLSTCVLD